MPVHAGHSNGDHCDSALYTVVLGTSSKYRHQLFATHFPSVPFTHTSPSIDEKAVRVGNDCSPRAACDPSKLTLAIAHAKADALLGTIIPTGSESHSNNPRKSSLLLTSDQVVVCHGQIREKPVSPEQCREFLRSYGTGDQSLQTVTAVVLTVIPADPARNKDRRRFEGVDVAIQQFHTAITNHAIDQLLKKGDVMYCAGGITVEDPVLDPFLAEPRAALDSIMGLPVNLLRNLFEQADIDIERLKSQH